MPDDSNFYRVLSAAMRDFEEHGYDNPERLAMWQERLRGAAEAAAGSRAKMVKRLRDAYALIYRNLIDKGKIIQQVPGVPRYTLTQLGPKLQDELTKRTMASIDLITLNRQTAVAKAVQRFSGWASSIPKGGSNAIDKKEDSDNIRKSIAGLPFEERRVIVDQGHKFAANLADVVAKGANALGAIWHSNWRQGNYDYREDHKERDGVFYVIRDNWAMQKGLMKLGGHQYADTITQPAEEPFCRCRFTYVFNLRSLPEACLTEKGKAALDVARKSAA